jgi:RNA polymerase-interacting CarD/CdnL/TRCF family regulator
MEHLISLSPRWAAARDDLRNRRALRAARENLARELATYVTPADQNELDAILDRADPDAADEIRSMIRRVA